MNGWLLIPIIIAAAFLGFAIGRNERLAKQTESPLRHIGRLVNTNPDPKGERPPAPPSPPALDGIITQSPFGFTMTGRFPSFPNAKYTVAIEGYPPSRSDWVYLINEINIARGVVPLKPENSIDAP